MRYAVLLLPMLALGADRYVATTGTDSGTCTNIASPCATAQYAQSQSSEGDTIFMRGGNYVLSSNFIVPTVKNITVRNYPGEIVVIDGGTTGGRRFFYPNAGNDLGTGWTFAGLKVIGFGDGKLSPSNGNIATIQFQHGNITWKGMRIESESYQTVYDTYGLREGFKILGNHWKIGHGIECDVTDTGPDDDYAGTCPGSPTYILLRATTANTGAATFTLNGGTTYPLTYDGGGTLANNVFAGNGHAHRIKWYAAGSRWEVITTPCVSFGWSSAANNSGGSRGSIIQDTVIDRVGANSDCVGFEGHRDILLERLTVRTTENTANDCLDVKATDVVLRDVVSLNCSAKGIGVWGYADARNILTNGNSFVGGAFNAPNVTNAVDDGGYIRITEAYNGMVPIPGMHWTGSGVNGCTGANGTFRIKDVSDKTSFRIETTSGGGTSCGGTFSSSPTSAGSVGDAPSGLSEKLQFGTVMGQLWFSPYGWAALHWQMYDSIVSVPSSTAVWSNNVMLRSSDRNQLYSGSGAIFATAYSPNPTEGTPRDGDQLATNEPNSHFGNPNLDSTTFRATATSPVTLVNRGYYAGWNSVTPGETRQILRWRAPAATDTCTANLYSDSGFTTLVESINSPAGPRWREVVFGATTPLSPATTYWHWISCGYDAMSGSAATLATLSGTASASATLGPPQSAAQTQAALDYSTDGSSWTSGTATACSTGCTLTAASLDRGQVYYLRTRRLDGFGATLATGQVRTEVVQ